MATLLICYGLLLKYYFLKDILLRHALINLFKIATTSSPRTHKPILFCLKKKSFSPAFKNVLRVQSSLIFREFLYLRFHLLPKMYCNPTQVIYMVLLNICKEIGNWGHLACKFLLKLIILHSDR